MERTESIVKKTVQGGGTTLPPLFIINIKFYYWNSTELKALSHFCCQHVYRSLKKSRGVCGTSWSEERTLVVPDVEQFPGHIACSSESRSEIVVPCRKSGLIVAVLDIDSKELAAFDEVDKEYLELIVSMYLI